MHMNQVSLGGGDVGGSLKVAVKSPPPNKTWPQEDLWKLLHKTPVSLPPIPIKFGGRMFSKIVP